MAWILIVFLILLGGLIAPFGDMLGTKIGKARFSILKLRPKKTATIVTIITGGFISAISIGLLLLVSEEFRQRLFVDIPFLQKTLDESKKALLPLQEERKRLEVKINNKEGVEMKEEIKIIDGTFKKDDPHKDIGKQKFRVRRAYTTWVEYDVVADSKEEAEDAVREHGGIDKIEWQEGYHNDEPVEVLSLIHI